MLFKRRNKEQVVDLQLASHYTISTILKNANVDTVFFKVGRNSKNYEMLDKNIALEKIKRSPLGADIELKHKHYYICIPFMHDII